MPTDVPKDTWHFLAVSNEFTGEKYFGGVGVVLYNSTGAPDGMDIFFSRMGYGIQKLNLPCLFSSFLAHCDTCYC